MAKLPNYTDIAGGAPVPQAAGVGMAGFSVPGGFEAEGLATAGMGKTLIGIGEEFAREQEKIDTIKVEDAWNKYKNAALDLTVGKDGLLNTQGEQAVNGKLLPRADQSLTTTRQEIMDQLGNPEQQRRFAQRADITDLQAKQQILQHLVGQTREYQKTVFQGSEAAARAQVTAAPTDQNIFNGARDTLMAQADAYLKSNGISDPNAVQAFKDKLNDGLWVTRIDALVYSQPRLADAMFRANSQSINSAETRLLLQARTREASIAVGAAMDAEDLIQQVRDIPRESKVTLKGMSREAALTMVNAALDRDPTNYDSLEAKYILEATGEQTTSGLPNSRDIAAQLPLVLSKVEKKADELYGKDRGNPDRAAYVKRLTSEIQGKIASDVQQLNAVQRQAQGELIDAVMGLGGKGGMVQTGSGGGGPGVDMGGARISSFSQLQSNPRLMQAYMKLDPATKVSLDRMIERNNAPDKEGDAILFREMFNRIHLEPGSPGKIDFYQQIIDPQFADRLSIPQINALRMELDRSETPGGRSLNQMRKAADSKVEAYFRTNVYFTAQPERQIAATMAWNEEVGKKIDAAAKQPNGGEVVRRMFMLDTPESVVSPAYLNTFVTSTPANGLAKGAAAVRDGTTAPLANQAQIPKAPATIKTEAEASAWIATLPAGTTQFIDPAGRVRQIQPRPQAGAEPGKPANMPQMTPKGEVIQPQAEPQMPTLVLALTPEQRRAARVKEGEATQKRDATITGAVVHATTVGAVDKAAEVVAPVAKAAGEAAARAGAAVVDALTPDDAARAVASFRTILQTKQYTPASESLIIDAMASGQLTPAETKLAAGMLRSIAAARAK